MKYTVFQINLSDAEYSVPSTRDLYLNTIMNPTDVAIMKARSFYKPVADINANSVDEVFQIGNVGPNNKISRKAPMHSISVGDVIVSETGVTRFVAPIGFGVLMGF